MESDEWVNIQVDAIDRFAMDRVEFYLDGQQIGLSTVAPFTKKWTIAMSDTVPMWNVDPLVISSTTSITIGELYVEAQTFFDGTTITVTRSITDQHWITTTAAYTTGRGIIADTAGYTETHVLKAIGFDKAGNQAESELVRIFTAHKPKEKPTPTPPPTTLLGTRLIALERRRRPRL
jgi:hypothetical protein